MAIGHHVCLCFWLAIAIISTTLAQPNNYIIHMDSTMMPKAFADHHSWYLATLNSALSKFRPNTTTSSSSALSSKLIYSYTHVINGFSASLSLSELEVLKTSPGYISSVKDLPVKPDTTHSSQFLGLSSKSGAWPVADYGKDVIIGLVDTGVWPESESYSDDGMSEIPPRWKGECESGTQFNSSLCNKKLIGARFFNKGLIAQNPNLTFSVNSTRDTEGHGTHTSSTAAGNYVPGASYFGYAQGTASGMAPKAHVAMYKALWEEGALSSDIIAAIEQAIIDGVDVLSLSFGLDGVALYEDPVAIATFSALEKGVFVSTSAGNEGPFFGTLHNGIPWVLTVAAAPIDRDFEGTAHFGNGGSVTGFTLFPGNSSSTQFPIVFLDACDSLKKLKQVGKKIVVCQDRNDSLDEQVYNVYNATVAGGLFITNNTDLEQFLQSPFPTIFLSPKEGEAIKDYINSNSQPTASLEFQKTLLGAKPAPVTTSYTSRGPSPSFPFTLKPDILAPGSLILAAWPQNNPIAVVNEKYLFGNFNLLSGTSMACPHAAGLAALLKAAYPKWSPAAIRSAMMTTSDTLDNTLSPIKDIGDGYQPASPLAMGADYINLLCALNYTNKQIQTITKSASNNCSTPSLDLNYPSFIAFFNANDSKRDVQTTQEFRRTVTYIGKGQSTYVASVTPLKGFEVGVVPNTLKFKEEGEKLSFVLSIKGPRRTKETVAFGYLTWAESGGEHVVRSPVVATNLSSDTVSQQS
ncbi:subtilisin-like protease SBT1.9 [Prunus yedoensis var. nudiflora]|uniref:Subtilisin-like protease SBT1.9 n=1 Tax=Prunus yedoensis var. nudiflora TaxID=2094558 RepID=A0A314Z8D5_PRUYE|nr:subtilisin-like protease SBT1.9 [Prunus yedoensis var. nudiflora]